ncbi:MAG: hypothetical protein EHM70_16290 [Chloroflexota bacterium]|nr:MAG: hypothetical protein EHM70_16290 [Chloroflexota bacterium]
MMKLSTMNAFFTTVDDQWRSLVADQILSHWEHDPGSAYVFRASSNFTVVFEQSGQKRFLRFAHACDRLRETIEAEIQFLYYLLERGVPVNRPLPCLSGNLVESVETSLGIYHAVVFEALEGEQLETDDLTPDRLVAWGKALGELHSAAEGYRLTARASWADQLDWALTILPPEETTARAAIGSLRQRLASFPVTPQNYGLIHFDFESDNLIWKDSRPGIIDFDDCAYSWFAADIGYALRDLFDDRLAQVDLNHPSFKDFVRGYRMARDISAEDLDQIPMLLLINHILKFTELLLNIQENPQDSEPEWLVKLRRKLASFVEIYRQELEIFIQPPAAL